MKIDLKILKNFLCYERFDNLESFGTCGSNYLFNQDWEGEKVNMMTMRKQSLNSGCFFTWLEKVFYIKINRRKGQNGLKRKKIGICRSN